MSINSIRRATATVVGASLALAGLAAMTPRADATVPPGAVAEVLLEYHTDTPDSTGDPQYRTTNPGYWGHEGPTHDKGTTFSLVATDASGHVTDDSIAALFAALGIDDPSKLTYAFLPASVDPTTITATEGEPIGQVVAGVGGWWTAAGMGSTWEAPRFVGEVSTQAQWAAYLAAGKPAQSYNDAGVNTSSVPEGTSVLNAWPSGTELRLLAIVTDGTTVSSADPTYALQSKVDPDGSGHLRYAELDFTTVAYNGHSSGGYLVKGVASQPTVSVQQSYADGTATLTATVKRPDGGTATDAIGTLQFKSRPGSDVAFDVSKSGAEFVNGVATATVSGIPAGAAVTYNVTFTSANHNLYADAVSANFQIDAPAVTPPVQTPPVETPIVTPPVQTPIVTPPAPKLKLSAAETKQIKKKSGTAKVGQTIKLAVPKKVKSKAKVSYQWYSSGKAIKGAKKSSFKISKKYKGKKLTVKVTYTKKGFSPYVKTLSIGKVKK